MSKKILALIMCALTVLTLVCCNAEKKNEEINDETNEETNEEKQPQNQNTEFENEDIVPIDINVKPLEKVEEATLSESAATLGFENVNLFHAFANAIGKKPSEVTAEDLDKVHFIAVGPEKEYDYSLFVGYIDYVDMCFSEQSKEPDFAQKLSEKVMISELVYNEGAPLSDLGSFKNVEMFEIYDVIIDDVSFVKNYNRLIYGFFRNNKITDVSGLSGYNPVTLAEIDFSGNEVADWSPVEEIKDKIVVFYDMASGIRITLESFLEQQENPVVIPAPEKTEQTQENKSEPSTDNEEFTIVDENGNPTDFSSLFD